VSAGMRAADRRLCRRREHPTGLPAAIRGPVQAGRRPGVQRGALCLLAQRAHLTRCDSGFDERDQPRMEGHQHEGAELRDRA
jgi:hypothetical protein